MTGGKDSGSGTSVEHKGPPSRTETDPVREEQPTLPDGVASPRHGIESLSPGTLDVPDVVGAPAVADTPEKGVQDVPSPGPKRPPFSGFWFEDADIEEADADDLKLLTRVSIQRSPDRDGPGATAEGPEIPAGDPVLPSEYVGPELETAPRFEDDTPFESTPLEALQVDSAPESSVPSTPSIEALSRQTKPVALDDDEERPDADGLDVESEDLQATDGLAPGDPPEDLRRDGPRDAAVPTSPDQLADADDDDQTDPQVPSARRISERPPRFETARDKTEDVSLREKTEGSEDDASSSKGAKRAGSALQEAKTVKPAESVSPPAVSVTLRPPPREAPRQLQKDGSPRELWVAAAVVVGVAAAAAVAVLVGADYLDSGANEKAVTAVNTLVDTLPAKPTTPPAKAAARPVEATGEPPVASNGEERDESAEEPPPQVRKPSRSPSSLGGSSIAERMRRAAEGAPATKDPGGSDDGKGDAVAEDPSENSMLSPFDRDAAYAALETVAANASSCRQPGDPTGRARVVVTFSPSSGRVTQATVSGKPFQGTAAGGCIARLARQVTVPPYAGSYTTVSKTISVR